MKASSKFLARILFSVLFILFLFNGSSFSQDLNPNDWPNLVGYWKFQDTSDLTKATVGNDLVLIGHHQWIEGAAYGDTAIRIDTSSYYKYYHGIAPNGGGDSVNQWTLMFDFKILNLDRWHCFFQTDTTNDNDGECFIRPNTTDRPGRLGVGDTDYSTDSILPNQWYRLVISANLGIYYNYYLNGVLLHMSDTDEIGIDSRFALTPAILFFADDHIEDDTIDIASLAIFDTCLSAAQIAQIGTIEPCIANPPNVNLGNDTTLCQGNTLQLNAGAGFKTYLWSTGDTTSAIALDTANFGIGPDTVWVAITDMTDCQTADTMIVTFVDCTGFDENHTNQSTILFPNPSSGDFNLMLSHKASLVSIYNSSGQKVKEFTNLKAGNHEINLSELHDGIYFVRIQGDKNCVNRKVLIVR
ncbi:MAG: T9SS type A sorting domain-containing protein [Saprospiraceae bacterium]|nr:T9SS type A sorting domain-containing protein [Saprospiraceae bacterium]